MSPGEGSLRWAARPVAGRARVGRAGWAVVDGGGLVVGAGVLGRRRRENAAGGRRIAHQVKVTVQEEAVLVRLAEAAGVSVPRLLVEAATSLGSESTPTQRREAIVELLRVSRVLAGVATNLNQLARSVNSGAEFPAQAGVVRERVRELIPRLTRAAEDLSDPRNRRALDPPPGRPGSRGLG